MPIVSHDRPSPDIGHVAQNIGVDERPAEGVPPRTPYEEAILAIWRDVLGRSDFGVTDDFFELNGHSLHAIRVVSRIRKGLGVHIPVRQFFESPTVAALASAVAAGSSSRERSVRKRPPDADPVLSYDQQRLWLENQLLPGPAYNVHGRRRLVGPLDVDVLGASIRAVVRRHEALRTRFPVVEGRPIQVVDEPDPGWRVTFFDLSTAGDPAAEACRLADEDAAQPFDFEHGPMFRCQVMKLGEHEHFLSVTVHHIVSDAWSVGLFVREVSQLYKAHGDVTRAGLPDLPVQYRDYAFWQRAWLTGKTFDAEVGYWREQLSGIPTALALPTARRRSLAKGAASGDRVRLALTVEETTELSDMCRNAGVTAFMAVLAALATVLRRFSGQTDIVVGVPVANRTDPATNKLIGFFVNTLPMRVQLSDDPTFADLLQRVRDTALGGYAHADAPVDVLVQELKAPRDPRRTPLFQVLLNVVDSPAVENIGEISAEPLDTPVLPSKFDIAVTAQESQGALQLQLEFNADQYQTAMMRTLVTDLAVVLRAAAREPTTRVLSFSFEASWQPDVPSIALPEGDFAVHDAVASHAASVPDRVALVAPDGDWSYRRLSDAAHRVAQVISEKQLPRAEQFGVVRRSTGAYVAAVLGCLETGHRVSLIEERDIDSAQFLGVSYVIDVGASLPTAPNVIDLSGAFDGEAAGSIRIAPDGGMAQSATPSPALCRFGVDRNDRVAVLTHRPGYLLSAMSTAFAAGATFVMPDQSAAGQPSALAAWLQAANISAVFLTPPVLRALATASDGVDLSVLRSIFIDNSGDFIGHDIAALKNMSPQCRCFGFYRIDGNGRPMAIYEIPDRWSFADGPLRVPLGREPFGTTAHLVHGIDDTAGVGEVGEICFGGYRTGDLGRRWPDGTLEYVGSVVEGSPDTIEVVAALRDVPKIRDAVVTEHFMADATGQLVGYVTGPDPTSDGGEIRQHLQTRLPENLIPAQIVVLDRLPLTEAGDYDFGALPEVTLESAGLDSYVAPRTPMEHEITDLLKELLGTERVGVYDSFFELGGFSLLATQLSSRIREVFGVEPSLRDVFEAPTVDGLAQLIVRIQAESAGTEDVEALLNEIAPTNG